MAQQSPRSSYFSLPNDSVTSRSENVDNPHAPLSPPYLKTIVRIPLLSILTLQSLENLIFSLDPLQSMAVRAPRKKYVSVVSLEIAYRSRLDTPPSTRVSSILRWPRFSSSSSPSSENSPRNTADRTPRSLDQHLDTTLDSLLAGAFYRDKASN